ncbi:protein SHORT ROOT IN SALT MEDIUM 1 [Humulus lupulus]|uniref:protein SHORT ROOT IN SALT MEDIUM 1 n=1 Tax=Humulus lupulus TaxID=3486 RepID=UPI002B405247|nr:protein SHORT ROOT IN SALT MEDIUM 1 [Humulus lupulus]
MYSSRGSNAYGQQSYAGQPAYGQNLGSAYSGSTVGGPDGGSQLSISSRHTSMLGASQEADAAAYRAHPSTTAHYGGQYGSLYSSAALTGVSQVPSITAKAGSSALESRGAYTSAVPDSPKFSSGDYVSSTSHGYAHKGGQLYGEKVPDYPVIDRRQYGERQSSYMGRDLQNESTGRFSDSVSFAHQSEIYDRIDQAVLLRQEQLLKSQSLQSASLDGSARETDYLAARAAAGRHPTQDLITYGGRMDADSRSISLLGASSYNTQHAPSILGAAPRRNADDLVYAQSSSNPGYGVSLPPGRDYAMGKGLHASSLETDYPSSVLPRSGHARIDELKDDRASYLREFELREEERRRERLRDRERDREREKDRDREREREREREKERDRERERIMERREKERERERKRALEVRRDRSLPRVSRDRRGSSLLKEGRSLRRESPQREALHRRRSPVKEKRREYVCKVYTSSLVDEERDYLCIDKRYPRLFISPEFSKAVVYWPKENLKLSIHTPISFEHDFIEEESASGSKKDSTNLLSEESSKSGHGNILWNAKFILMSGISKNALEELSSEKIFDDRIPHIYNILRFAVLKKDHSLMAIGGPWKSVDGGDPSVDDTSLTHTAQRYAKEIAQLDLQNCQHWNRFLEIHYDRVGKDGLFSHKEVTVLFLPDLSECLPSLDAWRDQWLAHQKVVAERDRLLSLRREKMKVKDALKDKDHDSSKDVKRVDKEEKKKEVASSGKAKDVEKKEKEKDGNNLKKSASEVKGDTNEKPGKQNSMESREEEMKVDKKEEGATAVAQTTGGVMSGKKKIMKKVVKQKVVGKTTGDTVSKQHNGNEKEENSASLEGSGQQDASSAASSGVKTFARKKVVKKVVKASASEDKVAQVEKKVDKETDSSGDKLKDNIDPNSAAAVQDTSVKTVKKKIIKRVPKRKIATVQSNDGVSGTQKEGDGNEKAAAEAVDGTQGAGKQNADADNMKTEVKTLEKKIISKTEKSDKMGSSGKVVIKDEKAEKKEVKVAGERSATRKETETDKKKISQKDINDSKSGLLKDSEKSKDVKEKKGKDVKDESRSKSNKELKEKKKPEEPPRHPGFILQTKSSKDSKSRSMSLALETLLDYSDKDVEESTFELSLFAETLCEMLQYQMGCRLFTFLQKLRVKFVRKRFQNKRQREEKRGSEIDKLSPTKRLKTEKLSVNNQSTQASETSNPAQPDDKNTTEEYVIVDPAVEVKTNNLVEPADEVKTENGTDDDEDYEEDPEEDPEEDEEMDDVNPPGDSSVQNDAKETNLKEEPVNEKDDKLDKGQPGLKATETTAKSDTKAGEKIETKVDTGEKGTLVKLKETSADKELLQAFRFFDRNRVGYIRVEDLRLIIHNLGKFLSHRDVKELVQSALLESNTGRDDRILYNKLVRMSDI